MPTSTGLGRKAQDWSYLSPAKIVMRQDALITNPSTIPDSAIIDTTVDSQGRNIERARHQTLVVYVMELSGATLPKESILYLWVYGAWDERLCVNAPSDSSSSSNWNCADVPELEDVAEADRWCLIAAETVANAANNGSLAFSFPWLPAGKYKVAIGADGAGTFVGPVAIAIRHTE